MIQRILVGLDGSPLAESVLPYVASLAKGLSAEITLLHVNTRERPGKVSGAALPAVPEHLLDRAQSNAEVYLKQAEVGLVSRGLRVTSTVQTGSADAGIIAYAQRTNMDLIALATHGRSGPQRWVYGSVAEKVVSASPIPVLLVRPGDSHVSVMTSISRIVVPLDGSAAAESALPVAAGLAGTLNVPLTLVQVIEPLHLYGGGPGAELEYTYPSLSNEMQDAAAAYLRTKAAELHALGLAVDTATPFGNAAARIIDTAGGFTGPLVVMATHGRTGLAATLLGSVARRVIQHGHTPVLVVRPAPAEVSMDRKA